MSRYDVNNSQGHYEQGSDEQVLANKLGITNVADQNAAELVLLEKLYLSVFEKNFPEGPLSINLLKEWHHQWLGNVYDWAGNVRNVNISKGGFMFASAAQLPRLLSQFEKQYLHRLTPCADMNDEQLTEAIAVIHVEFILIHPFREGNGRLSRLIADVMAVQAGHDPLDYQSWEENKMQYIAAIHNGLVGDYEPMKLWVKRGLHLVA